MDTFVQGTECTVIFINEANSYLVERRYYDEEDFEKQKVVYSKLLETPLREFLPKIQFNQANLTALMPDLTCGGKQSLISSREIAMGTPIGFYPDIEMIRRQLSYIKDVATEHRILLNYDSLFVTFTQDGETQVHIADYGNIDITPGSIMPKRISKINHEELDAFVEAILRLYE